MASDRTLGQRIRGRLRGLTRGRGRRVLVPRWLYVLAKKARPISFAAGRDRGTPVDRFFIERFINANSDRIRGAVLEVKDRGYTVRVGGSRVTRSDVVDVNRENKEANIISDIRNLKEIADNTYDCFIITQVLQYVDDLDAAVRESHRVIKPGGCLLVTAPTLGKLDGQEDRVAGHYWRLTPDSARYLFEKHFSPEQLEIEGWGNVLVATSFLQGMALEEIPRSKLAIYDPFFTCGVTIRATK